MQFRAHPSQKSRIRPSEKGVSLIELVVVLTMISILTAISVPYFFRYSQKYKTEDQAIKVMDLMREAAQIAITKRRTIRFDLNITDPARPFMQITNENVAANDVVNKTIPLEPFNEVRMDTIPAGVLRPNPPNYNDAAFTAGVWTIRFTSDGSVVTPANLPVSATLYFWSPQNEPLNLGDLNARQGEVRAVTIFGGSGAIRYWKHNGTTFLPN